jgi:hypothetical protein
MKIKEFIVVPKNLKDTTSCDTTSSGHQVRLTQDIVPQDIVEKNRLTTIQPEMVDGKILEMPDHSAISEGVSQIFRRKKGGAPTKGFRCTSGPRKGRIVAKPSTCFMKTDPVKSAKIRKKRLIKAKIAGKKLAITKRSRAGSKRLKGIQIKTKRMGVGGRGARPLQKSKTIKSK